MAISSGVRKHTAFLAVAGVRIPIIEGTVELFSDNNNSVFNVMVAMSFPGALDALTSSSSATVIANGQPLIMGDLQIIDFDMIARNITAAGSGMASALHKKKTFEKWTNKTSGQIVSDLANRVGLTPMVDGTFLLAGRKVKSDYDKLTDGVSFAHAISKLAERDGAVWRVSGDTLFYTTQKATGSYSLNYQALGSGPSPHIISDCLRLVIEYNVDASQGSKVTTVSWHPYDKKLYMGSGNAGGVSGGMPLTYTYHLPEMDQQHLMKFAQAKADEAARHAFTLDATVAGDPTLDPSMKIKLSGTQFFDGSYDIDIVRHNIGMNGFTTDIVAKTAGSGGGGGGGSGT